ncbi:O-antigen ligase family protein [Jannaschia sp. R86511]|uniref:O-antigen ligase family protein n=1 Tax=Jannaschia sp. R86511 TaxID=3093853 RepID=UPI0036D26AC1
MVVGIVVVSAYVLPARLVVTGLGAAGRPALLLGAALLGWWCLARLVPGLFVPGRNPLRVALVLYVLTFLVSVLLGFARDMPVVEVSGADRSLLRMFGLVGITLVVCDGVRTKERLDWLLRTYLAAAAFMAAVGTLQFVADIDLTRWLRLPGLVANGDLIGIAGRGWDINRVAGTAGHYIEFGVLLTLAVPIALHFGFHSEARWRRAMYQGLAAWLVLASFYSVSRSAIVCLLVAAAFTATGWTWRRKVNIAVLGVLFLVAVRAFQPGLLGTLRSLFTNIDNDPSIEGRTNDYEVVAPLIADRLWFGRGPGTYSPVNYVLLDNQWLNILITNGVVGVVASAGVIAAAVALAARTGRWAATDRDRNLGRALTASLLAAAVISLTFDSLSFSTFAVTLFFLLGVAGAHWRLTGGPRPGDRTPPPGVPL